MKIAIPSDDQKQIASHIGRALGFLLFEAEGNVVTPVGYHALGAPEQTCGCSTGIRPLRHQRILDSISGCEVVIARGMGAQLADDLNSCGFKIALTDVDDALRAAALFVAEALPERGDLGCDESNV